VILNYGTPGLVADCLRSLDGELDGERRLAVVVDNASPDRSVEQIKATIADAGYGRWARLLAAPSNGGFAAGNNIGIASTDAEHYVLLNSDTLVRPGALQALLDAARRHPEAGVLGPRLEWPDETPQISTFRDHSPPSELIDAAATGPVTQWLSHWNVPLPLASVDTTCHWLSFACVLIRRELLTQTGGLDDGYFMYYEDADFCRTARRLGWTVMHIPAARVVHLRGGSGDVKATKAAKKRQRRFLYESRSRYYRKGYGALGPAYANICWHIGRSISWTREMLGHRPVTACELQWKDNWIGAFSANPRRTTT